MPTLADKLKSLGVKVGARDLPPPRPADDTAVQQVIPGRVVETRAGETYIVDNLYAPGAPDRAALTTAPLDAIAAYAQGAGILDSPPEAFAFLDIETTGLMGGAGTYAFLVGVGRYAEGGFQLAQFFMRDPSEEAAHLLALEEFLAPCRVLVTFNGKAFDVPLLNTRYLMQGWRSPLVELGQLDLLHLARRLWRDRLPSRTLGNLEAFILGIQRTQDDIPGWMIPQMYFDYLSTGDARPLASVFYHNAMDVISMAALLDHIAHLLAGPLDGADHVLDRVAVGRLFEDLGWIDSAIQLYHHGLATALPDEIWADTLRRLSFLHKRRGDLEDALILWQEAAARRHLYAFVELAKAYEHDRQDAAVAFEWVCAALELLADPGISLIERRQWQPDLEKRRARLQTKIARQSQAEQSPKIG